MPSLSIVTPIHCSNCLMTVTGTAYYNEYSMYALLCRSCWEAARRTCWACHEAFFFCEFTPCGDCLERLCSECFACHECCQDDEEADEDQVDETSLHYSNYKPRPIFHPTARADGRFFGIELEIDGAGESRDNAAEILVHSAGQSLFYIKTDGSLRSGLEIVSHPCTYEFHRKTFPWSAIMKTASELGYRSETTKTCGLHIHVSRAAFGKTKAAQEVVLNKLVILFWRHWQQLHEFSRRLNYEWAKPNHDAVPSKSRADVLQHLERVKHPRDRYVAINTENADTIEFRLFKGTMKLSQFYSCLELVNLVIDMCHEWGTSRIYHSTWQDIVDRASEGLRAEIDGRLGSSVRPNPAPCPLPLKEKKNLVRQPVQAPAPSRTSVAIDLPARTLEGCPRDCPDCLVGRARAASGRLRFAPTSEPSVQWTIDTDTTSV